MLGTAGPPTITTFTPKSGPVGTVVSIQGTDLLSAIAVTFNGVTAAITKGTTTEIKVKAPRRATTGKIEVTTSGGHVASATHFNVT